ncbi:putative signaling protein [bioreactor metagenome]|uniref:Putative signaling protein n=1 Tax=bioreactor metagenome TaxID=1076179 RepID=A0A645H4A4_9ZZZZ
MYLDLDGFKEINDTYGHEFGDSILVTVGNRLVKSLKETDFVARLGGDEFAVLVEHVEGRHSVQNLVERIQTVMREVVRTDTVACSVDASIGAAIYPDDGIDGENLLRKADVAMYAYKKTKKQESDQGLTLQVSKQVGL